MIFELLLSHSEVLIHDQLYELIQLEEEHGDRLLDEDGAAWFHELTSRVMLVEYYYPDYYSTHTTVKVPQYAKDYTNVRL